MAKRRSTADRPESPERRASTARAKVVEASEWRLVDRRGRTRAMLEVGRGGPRLTFMHEDGTVALEVVLTREGPGVRLADERGKTRLFAGATRGAARIGMADAKGAPRLFLGLSGAGEPSLTLYDGTQRQAWSTKTAKLRSVGAPRVRASAVGRR